MRYGNQTYERFLDAYEQLSKTIGESINLESVNVALKVTGQDNAILVPFIDLKMSMTSYGFADNMITDLPCCCTQQLQIKANTPLSGLKLKRSKTTP